MFQTIAIKNGKVFDAYKNAFINRMVYIQDGQIISEAQAMIEPTIEVWDAAGKYVSPGFIDMHVHVFKGHAKIGIDPDKIGIRQGVTTIVDAGSTGINDLATFKNEIIDKYETDILLFLNLSKTGLVENLSELASPEMLMSEEELEKALISYRNEIVGLKARMSQSVVNSQGIKPLIYATNLLEDTDLPLMVHIGSPPPPLEEVLPLLREGDIVTHAFHGKKGGILTPFGQLIDAAKDALERGVKFDVGHGTSSFSFQTIRSFKEKYVTPFSISTDMYEANFTSPVASLANTMTKLKLIGYSLEEIIQAVTLRPAQALSLKNKGVIAPGMIADLTIFDLEIESKKLMDSYGETMWAEEVIIPYATWKDGKLIYQRSSKNE